MEMTDVAAKFALPVSSNATDLEVYAAEQAEIAFQINQRLIPVIVFICAVPVFAVLTILLGHIWNKRHPIEDSQLVIFSFHFCLLFLFCNRNFNLTIFSLWICFCSILVIWL